MRWRCPHWGPLWWAIGKLVHSVRKLYDPNICVSGGTDVVDLPDILLPAGQYLDLFDSESETDVPSDSSDEELVEV